MNSVLTHSSVGLQWCQIIWHHRKYVCALLCAPLSLLSYTVLLLWTGTSCIITRGQNIRRAGIPVPDPALPVGWNCPWEAAVTNEIGTGLDWWPGHSCSRTLEDAGCCPDTGHVAGEAGPLWFSQKSVNAPKDAAEIGQMRPLRWVKRIRNTCTVQYTNILCSASFLPFFLVLLNNFKLDTLGQIELSVLTFHHGRKHQFVMFLSWNLLMKKYISAHVVFPFKLGGKKKGDCWVILQCLQRIILLPSFSSSVSIKDTSW